MLLKDKRLAPHYVLEVRRKDHLDLLDVVVEARPEAGDGDREVWAADLAREVKSYVGVTVGVRVVPVGEIERSLGKAKRVIDLRDGG